MEYFKVTIGSMSLCGYDTTRVFAAENEQALYNDVNYTNFYDDMVDYIMLEITDEDREEYGDEAEEVTVLVEEITEEEFLSYSL